VCVEGVLGVLVEYGEIFIVELMMKCSNVHALLYLSLNLEM
jgi:hypothetical protein